VTSLQDTENRTTIQGEQILYHLPLWLYNQAGLQAAVGLCLAPDTGRCLRMRANPSQAENATMSRSHFPLGQHMLQCLFRHLPTELQQQPPSGTGLTSKQFPLLLLA
jgi:hypothetical protein